jgi:hypothetical protein
MFDERLVHALNDKKSQAEFIKGLAFTLGSFILPKFMIRGFSSSEMSGDTKKVVFRDCENGTLLVTKENSPFLRSLSKFGKKDKTAFLRHVPMSEVTEVQADVNECLIYDITPDFFGVLKHLDLKDKKMHVLTIYRLLFRFSIFALMGQLENSEFLLIVLQYL